MFIQDTMDNNMLVTLSNEPNMHDELNTIHELVSAGPDCDVIIDFTKVEMITSESVCALMILDKLLTGYGHSLVLCNTSQMVRETFVISGFESLFTFADVDTNVEPLLSAF